MPRLLEPLTEEEIEAAKRIIEAFKIYGAFVFEVKERRLFYNVIRKVGLEPLVYVKEASRRRPNIYVILLKESPCENECNYECRSSSPEERETCFNTCFEKCLDDRKNYLLDALRDAIEKSRA